MRKVIASIICLVLLSGCVDQKTISSDVKSLLKDIQKMDRIPAGNMNKKYYSYYLPSGIKRSESTEMSEVFSVDGYDLVMNFDSSAVIINNFYQDTKKTKAVDINSGATSNHDKSVLQKVKTDKGKNNEIIYTGYYESNNYQNYPYELILAPGVEEDYIIHMKATIVDFYCVVPVAQVETMIKTIFKISKSMIYDRELVLADFSMRKSILSKKENLDFVTKNFPEEGYLVEVEDHREISSPE